MNIADLPDATNKGIEHFLMILGAYVDHLVRTDKLEQSLDLIKKRDAWGIRLLAKSASPIEAMMAAEIAMLKFPDEISDFDVFAQHPVGKYKCDFYLSGTVRGKPFAICVECDGHDFHERTKEQAANDRARDREMLLSGVVVIRFTGSEIHRSPYHCATQITEYLNKLVSKNE